MTSSPLNSTGPLNSGLAYGGINWYFNNKGVIKFKHDYNRQAET